MFFWDMRGFFSVLRYIARWSLLLVPVSLAVGSACALFLWSLKKATMTHHAMPWLLFLLPLAGVVIAWLYQRLGKEAEGGNNLILEAITAHERGQDAPRIPLRMAPLILLTTVGTHLFGGSAGREGTAVQIGGALMAEAGRRLGLGAEEMRILLMAGIAAGFGGVFGTPFAGCVFAMEVLAIGRMRYDALFPCLLAAIFGVIGCTLWGIGHTHYVIQSPIPSAFSASLAGKVALAAVGFGLVATLFAEATHTIAAAFKRWVASPLLRPVVGGLIVIALVYLTGTRDFLGLGVSSPDPKAVSIVSCFSPGGAGSWSWFWKLLFTAITLGSGFKGGEVTPLFFVGAALGYALGGILGIPTDIAAALGFVAVFAGATNTPLACSVMGIELFGGSLAIYFAIACFLSYLCSGHAGIYLSQRVAFSKYPHAAIPKEATLRELRAKK